MRKRERERTAGSGSGSGSGLREIGIRDRERIAGDRIGMRGVERVFVLAGAGRSVRHALAERGGRFSSPGRGRFLGPAAWVAGLVQGCGPDVCGGGERRTVSGGRLWRTALENSFGEQGWGTGSMLVAATEGCGDGGVQMS